MIYWKYPLKILYFQIIFSHSILRCYIYSFNISLTLELACRTSLAGDIRLVFTFLRRERGCSSKLGFNFTGSTSDILWITVKCTVLYINYKISQDGKLRLQANTKILNIQNLLILRKAKVFYNFLKVLTNNHSAWSNSTNLIIQGNNINKHKFAISLNVACL